MLAAALFASVPALWSLATFGYSDGAGILAATLVAWAGVACWNRRTTGSVAWLGLAVALAGATRATALLVGLAVSAVVVGAIARGRKLVTWSVLALGPATVLTAWWYGRTWARFGDPTGSDVLTERLGRVAPTGGLPGRLVDVSMWQQMAGKLVGSSYDYFYSASFREYETRLPAAWAWAIGAVALVALIGLLLPPAARRAQDAPARHGGPVLGAVLAAVAFGIAGHVAEGGAPHPRYLLVAMPVLAVLTVVGLDRLHPGLAAAVVAGVGVASAAMLVLSVRWVDRVIAADGLARFGPAWLGRLGGIVVGLGLALVVVGAAAVLQPRVRWDLRPWAASVRRIIVGS